MIHALRYEHPDERYIPHERQRHEEQDKHIHVHVHLSFPIRKRHSAHPGTFRATRIFAALVGATAMALSLFGPVLDNGPSTLLLNIAGISILAGLALAWGAALLGGFPLLDSAARSTPRVRFLLRVLLAFLILVPLLLGIFGPPLYHTLWPIGPGSSTPPLEMFLGTIVAPFPGIPSSIVVLLLYVYPLIGTILLNRAIRQATIADKWLRFASRLSYVVVGAMVLILLSGILWSLALMQGAPTYVQLHLLLGMGIAVIVAIHTLFSRSRNNAQTRPHDDFPYDDVASSGIDEG